MFDDFIYVLNLLFVKFRVYKGLIIFIYFFFIWLILKDVNVFLYFIWNDWFV